VAQNSFARTSQNGQSFYIGKYVDSFYFNGFAMTSLDNRVSNGVVHVLSMFSVPPIVRGNLQTVLNATGQHSLFIAALTKANRWTTLGTTSVFTILAPTDAAMTAAGYTTTSISAAPVARMDSLVRYHMFSGSRLFSNDFGNKTSPGTFLSTTKTIVSSSFGRQFKGISNLTPVSVTVPNILGTNGVVHIIDGVLRY
jgi:transforming growth factor-beta-induced protein